jgi:hypothetical protein
VQSVFSGLAIPSGRPAEPITQLTSGWLRLVARPFLPSTCAILQQDEKLSTPKVGANPTYFCVRIFFGKQQNAREFFLGAGKYSTSIHIFFTEMLRPCANIRGESNLFLDESRILKHLVKLSQEPNV